LLLVDSSDLHGTGFSDGGPLGSIDAREVGTFMATLLLLGATIDLLASGRRINSLRSYRTMSWP